MGGASEIMEKPIATKISQHCRYQERRTNRLCVQPLLLLFFQHKLNRLLIIKLGWTYIGLRADLVPQPE